MTNGQQPKGRHSDGFRMKLLLWARFWTWRKVKPSEMKWPTQFYPTHNVRFIGETVHRKGSLNFNKRNTRNARSGAVFHTKYQYSPNSSIYLSILYTISKRHGKPPLGTAGIVVICLRLFECYSSRGIRKENGYYLYTIPWFLNTRPCYLYLLIYLKEMIKVKRGSHCLIYSLWIIATSNIQRFCYYYQVQCNVINNISIICNVTTSPAGLSCVFC